MSTEMIQAIATLWPLALIVFFAGFTIYFRKPLWKMLERGGTRIHIRRGQTEVAVVQDREPPARVESPPEEKPALEKPIAEVGAKGAPQVPEGPGDWRLRMFEAASAKNVAELEKAFLKLQENTTDQRERLENEISYHHLRFDCGDTSSIGKLEEIASRNPDVASSTYAVLGRCFEEAREFERAVQAYEASVSTATTDEERAERTVALAVSLYPTGQWQNGLSKIMAELGNEKSSVARATLYTGLARLFELQDDSELRALALEKAVELKPNDPSLRFRTAYSYGNKQMHYLALLHYRASLEFKPNDESTLNNLGVAYERLDLPIISARFYRKAADKGLTLAMANLAQKYLQAGFVEQAAEVLEKAKQMKQVHPNVGRALATVADKEKEQNDKESDALKEAHAQQKFLRSFAESYFTPKPDEMNLSGSWRLGNLDVPIVQTGTRVEAAWSDKVWKYRVIGNIQNHGVVLERSKAPGFDEFSSDGRGYAHLAPDGSLQMMTIAGGKHRVDRLERFTPSP